MEMWKWCYRGNNAKALFHCLSEITTDKFRNGVIVAIMPKYCSTACQRLQLESSKAQPIGDFAKSLSE